MVWKERSGHLPKWIERGLEHIKKLEINHKHLPQKASELEQSIDLERQKENISKRSITATIDMNKNEVQDKGRPMITRKTNKGNQPIRTHYNVRR